MFNEILDVLLLGRVADEATVGLYGLGMIAILAPCQIFSLLTVAVGFPALSILQDDKNAVRRGTAAIFKVSQLLCVPLFIMIAITISSRQVVLSRITKPVLPLTEAVCITLTPARATLREAQL